MLISFLFFLRLQSQSQRSGNWLPPAKPELIEITLSKCLIIRSCEQISLLRPQKPYNTLLIDYSLPIIENVILHQGPQPLIQLFCFFYHSSLAMLIRDTKFLNHIDCCVMVCSEKALKSVQAQSPSFSTMRHSTIFGMASELSQTLRILSKKRFITVMRYHNEKGADIVSKTKRTLIAANLSSLIHTTSYAKCMVQLF